MSTMPTEAAAPVRGNTGLYLLVDGVQYGQDCKSVVLEGEEADDSDLTFLEAAQGGEQADALAITAIQSTKAGSLWRKCWDEAGQEVPVVYGPHGNALPTADKPHFVMVAKLGVRPRIGGEARRTKERQDFEASWELMDGPTLDDGA